MEESYHSGLLCRGVLDFKYTDNASKEVALLRKACGVQGWCHQSKKTFEI